MSTARMEMKNDNTKQLTSNQASPLFFNQKPNVSNTPDIPLSDQQDVPHPPEQLILQSTTDILLAAILQQLKMLTTLQVIAIKKQEEQEQDELKAADESKEVDNARFNNCSSMYI